MDRVPDALSLAAMRYVSNLLGRKVGGSTGTNFVGILWLMQRMQKADLKGSLVTLLCDSGDRNVHSYYNPEWYVSNGIDAQSADALIAEIAEGRRPLELEDALAAH